MTGFLARARSFWRGLRRPEEFAAAMDEEMRFHMEMEAERLVREQGLEPEEAHRKAAIAFGGVSRYQEEGREARGLGWIVGLPLDLRLGLRMLVKHPGITLVGAAGMAVAIAISAAVFSVIGTITNPSVPLDEGGRIVAIDNLDAASGAPRDETHLHDLAAWREDLSAVGEIGAFRTLPRNLIGPDGRAEPLRVAEMTASGFRIARVPPLLGRYLIDEDEREGAPRVVVLGYGIWLSRFAARPDVVGRTIHLAGEPHVVVGVMPDGFAFPVNNRLWTPLRLDPLDYPGNTAPAVNVFGRLAPGATLEQARAQLEAIGRRMATGRAPADARIRSTVLPYGTAFMDDPQLLWTFHLVRLFVGFLLIVVAANVAILVYARTATRAGEIAVRLALGASRARVAGQLFAEALALSALAAALGLLAAHFILRRADEFFKASGGEQLPFWWDFRVTPSTALYSVGLALLAAGIVGVLPALRLTAGRAGATLREMTGSTGLRMGRTWTALITLQITLAVSLIPLAAAIPLRELVVSRAAPPPVSPAEIFTAEIALDRDTPPATEAQAYDRALQARFADRSAELVRRLEAEPGVVGAALASSTPAPASFRSILIEPRVPASGAVEATTNSLEVEPEVFDLFGATLLAGRPFQPADLEPRAATAIVNRSFVDVFLGGGEALGRRFRYGVSTQESATGAEASAGWYEIVGVVSDFPGTGMGQRDAAAVYHATGAAGWDGATLLVRAPGLAPGVLAQRMREVAATVDPALRLGEISSVADFVRRVESPERLLMLAIATLPWTIMLLSAAGVHALVSLTVSQRRKEIGLRIALGARPAQVIRGIAARALRQVALGIGIGAVVAGVLIPTVTSTSERAAALVAAIATILLVVCLVAVVAPARNGLRIQPMEALRGE
ncbi:MAG TPA: ABC transporter permease [Longimicrobiaceae bacterium]